MCSYRLLLLPLLIIVTLFRPGAGSNILGIFPHFGYSHFLVYYPILRGLAERGHHVTVITYIENPEPHPNYEELLIAGSKKTVNVFSLDFITPSRSLPDMIDEFFALHNEGQQSCDDFYQSGYVEKVLKRHASTPYDLVIAEFFNTDCYLGVPHLLQVPVVGLSSCALMPWYYDRILLPDTPAHVQSEFIGFPEVLNWQQRLVNFVQAKMNKWLYRYFTNYRDNKIIEKYLHIDVDINEIANQITSLIFVNQFYSLSGNRPSTPQLIEMGGIHVDERKINATLPPTIETFLQQSPNGVLFISWGSMVQASTIDKLKLEAIVEVLQKLPLRIIWKWEDETVPIKNKQFLFTKWAPQLTLLCHPKVKLFWGHGGLLGVTEAVHCGKPLILTPIYGDQFLNAHAVENRQIGKIMFYDEIGVQKLEALFQEVMTPSYSNNALIQSNIFRHRETKPLETTLWWIEHLLRHGKPASDVLRTQAVNLNWFVYYSLDSVALLLVASMWLLLGIWRIFQIARLARKRWQSRKVKKS